MKDLNLLHTCYFLGLESKLRQGEPRETCFLVNPETAQNSFNQKTQTFQLLQVLLAFNPCRIRKSQKDLRVYLSVESGKLLSDKNFSKH